MQAPSNHIQMNWTLLKVKHLSQPNTPSRKLNDKHSKTIFFWFMFLIGECVHYTLKMLHVMGGAQHCLTTVSIPKDRAEGGWEWGFPDMIEVPFLMRKWILGILQFPSLWLPTSLITLYWENRSISFHLHFNIWMIWGCTHTWSLFSCVFVPFKTTITSDVTSLGSS